MFSIPHMVVLFVIVLVVFGPQKLPELARSLGKLMAEFRKASTDFKGAFEEEMRAIERQALETERKKAADAAAAKVQAEPSTTTATDSPEPSLLPPPQQDGHRSGPIVRPAAESIARSSGTEADLFHEQSAEISSDVSPEPSQEQFKSSAHESASAGIAPASSHDQQ